MRRNEHSDKEGRSFFVSLFLSYFYVGSWVALVQSRIEGSWEKDERLSLLSHAKVGSQYETDLPVIYGPLTFL